MLRLIISILLFVLWIKGVIMAFSASVLLGIVCLFVEIPYLLFSVAYWVTGVDLAQRIVHAFPGIFS
jgi:hypothetical protein